jgi:hypothetical protein
MNSIRRLEQRLNRDRCTHKFDRNGLRCARHERHKGWCASRPFEFKGFMVWFEWTRGGRYFRLSYVVKKKGEKR